MSHQVASGSSLCLVCGGVLTPSFEDSPGRCLFECNTEKCPCIEYYGVQRPDGLWVPAIPCTRCHGTGGSCPKCKGSGLQEAVEKPAEGCAYSASDLFGPPKNCAEKAAYRIRLATEIGGLVVPLCAEHARFAGILSS